MKINKNFLKIVLRICLKYYKYCLNNEKLKNIQL